MTRTTTSKSPHPCISRRSFVRAAAAAAALTLSGAASLAGCSGSSGQSSGEATGNPLQEVPPTPSTPWTNTDILGALGSGDAPNAHDDYHAAMNRSWLTNVKIPSGMLQASAYTERASAVVLQMKTLLAEEAGTGTSGAMPELAAMQALYALLDDADARNASGVEPLLSQLRSIERIYTLEDLTSYLTSGAWTLPPDDTRAAKCADWLLAPMAAAVVAPGEGGAAQGAVWLYPPALSLGDPAEYSSPTKWGSTAKTADSVYIQALFVSMGCTESAAAERYKAMDAFEKKLAACMLTYRQRAAREQELSGSMQMTLDELANASPAFPAAGIVSACGVAAEVPVRVVEPNWLAGMQDLYVADSIDGMKAMLQARLLAGYAPYLDQASADLRTTWLSSRFGAEGTPEAGTLALRQTVELLGPIVSKPWCDRCLDSEVVADAATLAEQVRIRMKAMIDTTPWLSDAASAVGAAKLEAMTIRIGAPAKWPDCSSLAIPGASSNAASSDGASSNAASSDGASSNAASSDGASSNAASSDGAASSTTSTSTDSEDSGSADAIATISGLVGAIRTVRKFREGLSAAKASAPDNAAWAVAPH